MAHVGLAQGSIDEIKVIFLDGTCVGVADSPTVDAFEASGPIDAYKSKRCRDSMNRRC